MAASVETVPGRRRMLPTAFQVPPVSVPLESWETVPDNVSVPVSTSTVPVLLTVALIVAAVAEVSRTKLPAFAIVPVPEMVTAPICMSSKPVLVLLRVPLTVGAAVSVKVPELATVPCPRWSACS